MDKLVLQTGTEINISDISSSQNSLVFTATGITNYDDFKASLSEIALSDVKHYIGENLAADYGNMKLVYPIRLEEQEGGSINAIITLEKENDIERRLRELEEAVDMLILSGLGGVTL